MHNDEMKMNGSIYENMYTVFSLNIRNAKIKYIYFIEMAGSVVIDLAL